jgi:hypothetical protein
MSIGADVRQAEAFSWERAMNLEDQVREAIIGELQRQSEAAEQGLRIQAGDAEMITIEGRVNLDELTMAVVGSLAGGP